MFGKPSQVFKDSLSVRTVHTKVEPSLLAGCQQPRGKGSQDFGV